MIGPAPVCLVSGVRGTSAPVPLFEGFVYYLGRQDRDWLRRTNRADVHLALGPTVRTSVSAVCLTLAVQRSAVEVTAGPNHGDTLVDLVPIGTGKLVLSGPLSDIVVDPAGRPQAVSIRFPGTSEAPVAPALHSGSTVKPQLVLSGDRVRLMAAALAWPLLREMPPPLCIGWSNAQVEERFRELFGQASRGGRHDLFEVRRRLVDACSEDGRLMALIPEVQPWPWPKAVADSAFGSEQALVDGWNLVTAQHVGASGLVDHLVSEALDRPRRR